MSDKKDIQIMIGDTRFNFRVGAIMQYEDKIIVENGKSDNMHCVLPGGRVMTCEDTKEALIREIQEEMHFDISDRDIVLCHIIENFFVSNGIKCHEIYFVYKVELNKEDRVVNLKKEEFVNYDSDKNTYEFVPIDKIDEKNLKPEILKKIVKTQKMGRSIMRDM